LRARQAIKKVLYKCLPCKITKNNFGQEREAPTPADRVTASKPFQVIDIDFAGPSMPKGRLFRSNAISSCSPAPQYARYTKNSEVPRIRTRSDWPSIDLFAKDRQRYPLEQNHKCSYISRRQTKGHKKSRRLLEMLGKGKLLDLRNFHEVSKPNTR